MNEMFIREGGLFPNVNKFQIFDRAYHRALVVEDDLSMKPFWEEVMRDRLIKIDWAISLRSAEEYIRRRCRADSSYDLIISDVFLEGPGTGIDLWNRYGELAGNFLFVSAVPFSNFNLMPMLNYGHPIFLQKPLSFRKCREVISDFLDQNGGNV